MHSALQVQNFNPISDADAEKAKYRLFLIQPFMIPEETPYSVHRSVHASSVSIPKEKRLMDYENIRHLLEDGSVWWEFGTGPLASYGNWPVETREEFALVGAGRLAIVREACKSGKYNGIVLLGGGEPGLIESREIGKQFGIPVTGSAFAQMHVASMLGNKFSVIDISEVHNMYYYNLVVQHRFTDRCASIRNINFPLPRPGHPEERPIRIEREKANRGERSAMVEAAVDEAIAAIEEDGAEVLIMGCSASFWLRPYLQNRLAEVGWDVPVLDGIGSAIALCKMMIDLRVDASGLMLPPEAPKKWRRKKTF